jgi:transcriptional regulator with XRE-family HTH domain
MTTAENTTSPRMPTLQEFAACIKIFRELRKWSQEQLADISGLTVRTIQRVEKGEPSSTDTLRAFARAFELEDIDILVDDNYLGRAILNYREFTHVNQWRPYFR